MRRFLRVDSFSVDKRWARDGQKMDKRWTEDSCDTVANIDFAFLFPCFRIFPDLNAAHLEKYPETAILCGWF
jgi:hypothetical protein